MTPTLAAPLPLLGTDAEFRALRLALRSASFTEEAVRARLGNKAVYDFISAVDLGPVPDDPLGVLVWLLTGGASIPKEAATKIPVEEMRCLGLIKETPGNTVSATALLHPLRGLFIASDRVKPIRGAAPSGPSEDVVYPAITPNTELFLDMLPFEPCDSFLDLCAGCGAAALIAVARGAKSAWSCDLTERCSHFAEFNRRLNGLENVTVSTGDLYAAAQGQTFDRIVAHPPYVALFKSSFIFDSGGQDGERVVRGMIEGLPRHLRPGGRFFSLTMGTDRQKPFEERVRQWLGAAGGDFDVSLVTRRVHDVMDYTADMMAQGRCTREETEEWRSILKESGVENFVYGFLCVQRRQGPRPVYTIRRKASQATGPAEHSWMVAFETSLVENGPGMLLKSKPRASADARMTTTHRLTPEGWTPESFLFELERPFDMEFRADGWAAYLLAAADGTQSGAQLLSKLQADSILAPTVTPIEFAQMLGRLASGGFLKI